MLGGASLPPPPKAVVSGWTTSDSREMYVLVVSSYLGSGFLLCKNQNNKPHPPHPGTHAVRLIGSAISEHPTLYSEDLHLPDPFVLKQMVGKVCAVCAGAVIPHVSGGQIASPGAAASSEGSGKPRMSSLSKEVKFLSCWVDFFCCECHLGCR